MNTEIPAPRFRLRPLSLREANAFVEAHHRHHRPVPGAKFSLAVCIEGDPEERIVGVAIVGRPVARLLDDGGTLEVTRLCTDGTRNSSTPPPDARRALSGIRASLPIRCPPKAAPVCARPAGASSACAAATPGTTRAARAGRRPRPCAGRNVCGKQGRGRLPNTECAKFGFLVARHRFSCHAFSMCR
jgi:hypothetical protein